MGAASDRTLDRFWRALFFSGLFMMEICEGVFLQVRSWRTMDSDFLILFIHVVIRPIRLVVLPMQHRVYCAAFPPSCRSNRDAFRLTLLRASTSRLAVQHAGLVPIRLALQRLFDQLLAPLWHMHLQRHLLSFLSHLPPCLLQDLDNLIFVMLLLEILKLIVQEH